MVTHFFSFSSSFFFLFSSSIHGEFMIVQGIADYDHTTVCMQAKCFNLDMNRINGHRRGWCWWRRRQMNIYKAEENRKNDYITWLCILPRFARIFMDFQVIIVHLNWGIKKGRRKRRRWKTRKINSWGIKCCIIIIFLFPHLFS